MPDFSRSRPGRRGRAAAIALLALLLAAVPHTIASAATKHGARVRPSASSAPTGSAAATPPATTSPPAAATPPAATSGDDDSGADVTIGGHGVTVTVGDSGRGRRVVVIGPHVRVDEDGQIVRLFTDVVVPAGQRVDGDVVTVFGSSKVDGHVSGNVVAVFGSVTLGTGSAVDGDMVAVLGGVHRSATATVGGETVDLGFEPLIPGLPALPTVLLLVGMFWVFSLIGGWIVALVMPGRLVRITATASRRMGGALLLGMGAIPLVVLTVVLLCITVIGIPVALLLPIAFGFVMWIGQYAGFYGLGQKLLRRRLQQGSIFGGLVTGTLFVTAFFVLAAVFAWTPGVSRSVSLFLFAVGSLICIALQLIGCGAVLLSRFGTRPVDLGPAVAPAPATVLPPAPHSAAPPVGA